MYNIQYDNNLGFPEDIFDDLENDNVEFMDIIEYQDNFDVNINLLIEVLNDAIDEEEEVNVICEMDEEVPLRKKIRLYFNYEVIEN